MRAIVSGQRRLLIRLVLLVLIIMIVFAYYQNNYRANNVIIDKTHIRLTFNKKADLPIAYTDIDKVHIACGHTKNQPDKDCGLTIVGKDSKTYTTNGFTNSDNAKKIRDEINQKLYR